MGVVSNPLAAELPPNHRTPPGARLLGAVQLTGCAGCAGAPLEERVALAIPTARRAGRGHTDRSSEGRKAGRQALVGRAWGRLLAGSGRWPEMARARAQLAGEVAVGVLRAWQARNCVPKLFHYFELVLLAPLRQPKLGPPPSQPCSSRQARRDRAHLAQNVHQRSLRARKPKETEIWQRTRGHEGRPPFAPQGVENSSSNGKLLPPSTVRS